MEWVQITGILHVCVMQIFWDWPVQLVVSVRDFLSHTVAYCISLNKNCGYYLLWYKLAAVTIHGVVPIQGAVTIQASSH